VPKGLKPVRKRLASGEVRTYWYHRATGKALRHDPETAEGLLEVAGLDATVKAVSAVSGHPDGSFAALWAAYASKGSDAWTSLRPRTRSDYQRVRDWIGAAAERVHVRAMTSESIIRLCDKATKEKGRRFGKYVLQVIRLVLGWGKDRGWLKHNPAADIRPPRRKRGTGAVARKVNRPWSLDEIEAFATDCPFQLLVPFALGLLASMREGDALTVTWTAREPALLRWIASKNGEECTAPMGGALERILGAAQARRGDAVQIAVNSYGMPWTESGFRASFFKRIRALRAAGAVRPGLTFHGLRHTIGTGARDRRESDFRVAAAIGDRSTAMAQTYGRDADRARAQQEVLAEHQAQFANNDWKLPDVLKGNRVAKTTRRRG